MSLEDLINKLDKGSRNPGAPSGLQQFSASANAAASAAASQGSSQQAFLAGNDVNPAAQAQQWYTGRNLETGMLGWDSDFEDEFQSGWTTALEEGNASNYFSTGTGVVTWDHEDDEGNTYEFGDVVKDGEVVANVYQDYGRDGGNLLMLARLADGTEQARLFDARSATDALDKVDEFVNDRRARYNTDVEQAVSQSDFQKRTEERLDSIYEGLGGFADDVIAIAGGFTGGAVTGGAAAATLAAPTGVGTGPAAIAGGTVGGVGGAVGAWMNKDELLEQMARGLEITEMAREDYGTLRSVPTAILEAAKMSQKFTSPLSNLTHGTIDVTRGEVGDRVVERFKADEADFTRNEDGSFQTGSTADGIKDTLGATASWLALAGDSVLQFLNPVNQAIYATQMGGVVGGESLQLVATGGSAFDPREGRFDNIFKDDNGNIDVASGAAGIGKIAIDAVQMTGMLALARSSNRAAAAGGTALSPGGASVEAAGRKFIMDDAGEITVRKSLTFLAPSEMVSAATASRRARLTAMGEYAAGRRTSAVVTADDLYKASTFIPTRGGDKLKAALVNGFGEGYEEAVQAILEPISMDGRLSGGDIANSFLYGTAGGFGNSLGATFVAPSQDQRLSAQAYALEVLRTDADISREEWDARWKTLSQEEKRIAVSRTPAEMELVKQSLKRIAEDQSASLVATEVDAARAMDSRRKVLEKELQNSGTRSDAFHVMSGAVDAGRVSPQGIPLGDTAPAEAISMGARTVLLALSNRLQGMTDQIPSIADPELAQFVEASRLFGENLVADLEQIVEQIYDEATDEVTARRLTSQLNKLLTGLYERTITDIIPPEGFTGDTEELRDAAAHFVSLLQSREPKLDAGSFLAVQPYADWELTRTGSDNFIVVNTDILQAINGDFDGDKLHSENQLILSRERFASTRAGDNFGGAGESIDMATRNFEPGLVALLGTELKSDDIQLRDEAEATLGNIRTAITAQYGQLLEPDALARVFSSFETAVRAGSPDARMTLLNAMAREAGQAISQQGQRLLRNEWINISRIVRSNLEMYQVESRRLRFGAGPSEMIPTEDIDTPKGTNQRKTEAATDAQTLALFADGNTLFRKFQKIHYTWFNSSVLRAENVEAADLTMMVEFYEELAKSVTRSEIAATGATDPIVGRVLVMLQRLVEDAMRDPQMRGKFNPSTAMAIFANVKVKDVFASGGEIIQGSETLSLAQVLLRRALDADRDEHARTFETDTDLQAKHAKLRKYTRPNKEGALNAERAFFEVFKNIPFANIMGGRVGNLAAHTTPEQWMQNYVSLDPTERTAQKRFFTQNVPEYLDRDGMLSLPYSLDQAKRGEVTAYRSTIDALLAVGNARLTFDPAKPSDEMFGGELAQLDKDARDGLLKGHEMVREAMASYRPTRTGGRRPKGAELVQQMFAQNPKMARDILEIFPGSLANALYEYRDGQLFVAPWIYKMFAIEDSNEAVFFYWKNLVLTQWNATQHTGRTYDKLNSRFMRLMLELAEQPGQYHLEVLLRQLDSAGNLNDFFKWINTTPGYRGQQAPFLPFVDDVADFENDSIGSFTTAGASADLRTAISKMSTSAEQLRDTMLFRETTRETNRLLLDGIKRARNGDPQATQLEQENLRKLQKALSIAQELPRAFSPNAMLALAQGAMNSFDAGSHEKGKTAESYGPLGQFQALMDAFGFMPGLERMIEAVTANSFSSIRNNIGDLARTSGTAMDANGQPVTWDRLDIDTLIELLDNPDTEDLGHALAAPKALDLSMAGPLVERTLVPASLKDLLDDRHYKRLFEPVGNPSHELDQAMRYLSMIDAKARTEGGHFGAIRAALDLAISRTSGLKSTATPGDLARLRDQAFIEVANILKLVGQIQTDTDSRDAGVLKLLREHMKAELRKQRKARSLPGFTDGSTGEVVEQWVEMVLDNLERARDERLLEAANLYEGEELDRRSDQIQAMFESNAIRVRAMLDDDPTLTAVQRYHISGDDTLDAAAKVQIEAAAMSATSFPRRAPEAADAWTKLANQREAGLQADLTTEEWQALGRAAMGLYLTDATIRVASHVSIPPFPKGDPTETQARFYKYFDPTFSYLGADLLEDSNPLVLAAQWLHLQAEQPRTTVDLKVAQRMLDSTILDRRQLGAWTPGLMSQLVEVQTRMDSAGGPAGIGAAGNGPKRNAVIGAATRRTGAVPGAELLSTATFTADMLDEPFSLLTLTPAGHSVEATMPLAQLNNRFFGAVRIDGDDVPLDYENLGYVWEGADEENSYRYIALDRLKTVVERYATISGKPISEITIEADFFHPDSQPVGWMNNAFFDGMMHSLLPDNGASLLSEFWSGNGGKIAKASQWVIDAGKKGKLAIMPFRRPSAGAMADVERLWTEERDLAALLRAKTELIVRYDDGSDPVGVEGFNAIYKQMKLQHIIVGMRDNEIVALTAEEAIALQASQGRDTDFGLENARLVVLSPDVLRTMMGETNTQGVSGFFTDDFVVNPQMVDAYEGITQQMLERFGRGWMRDAVSPQSSSLANVDGLRVQTVRTMLTTSERARARDRIVYLDQTKANIHVKRQQKLPGAEYRQGLLNILRSAQTSVMTERSEFDMATIGAGAVGPRNTMQADHSARALSAAIAQAEGNSYARGWEVMDEGSPSWVGGTLTVEAVGEGPESDEHRIVKDDWVLLRLDTFDRFNLTPEQKEERLRTALTALSNTGAYIVLGSGNGGGDLRFEASLMLQEMGYYALAGSSHIFGPIDFEQQSQNERAYDSTFYETDTEVVPANTVVTFISTESIATGTDRVMNTDENAGIVNPATRKLRDRKVVNNLLQTSAIQNYNLPLDDNQDDGLYARTLQNLRLEMRPGTPTRARLKEMAGKDPRGVMTLDEALDRFHSRITANTSLIPESGSEIRVGDILPFVHPDGKVYLYRHGMRMPKDLAELNERMVQGNGFAIATSETDPNLTANDGTIRYVKDRVNSGRQVQIEMPLQLLGDKIQLDFNGMKFILLPPIEGFAPPPLFANSEVVDIFTDAASVQAKEATHQWVLGYRDMLTFFQFNFTSDVTKVLLPNEDPSDPGARVMAINILRRLSERADLKIPLAQAVSLSRANVAMAEALSEFTSTETTLGLDPTWTDRLADTTDPSVQITRAILTYLMTPGANLDNVLKSAGFSHPNANDPRVTTRRVPGIFADLLDHGMDSALHEELTRRFDGQFYRGPNGEGFRLTKSGLVEMYNADGTYTTGWLMFGQGHSSGDSPVTDGQAFDATAPADFSPHNAAAASLAVDGAYALRPLKESKKYAQSFSKGGGLTKQGDSVWRMLTTLPETTEDSVAQARRETPLETMRRAAAREEIVGLFTPLNREDWKPGESEKYDLEVTKTMQAIKLFEHPGAMVDTWVRMQLGRPWELDENGVERGKISGSAAIETVVEIRNNLLAGRLPTYNGAMPHMPVNHLTTIYLANFGRENGWAPTVSLEKNAPRAGSWDAWVETAFGEAYGWEDGSISRKFDSMYLLAMDGLMHEYQGATTSTRYLPVSSDLLIQFGLMEERTNRMLVSISSDVNANALDPMLLDTSRAELDHLISGVGLYAHWRDGENPMSAKGKEKRRNFRWRKEVDAPRPTNTRMRGVRSDGQTFIQNTSRTTNLFRFLYHLRVGNVLFNVALIAWAPVDAMVRRTISATINNISGEGTGMTSRMLGRVGELVQDTSVEAIAQQMGLEQTYTREQRAKLNDMIADLATLPEFKAMVYKELQHQQPAWEHASTSRIGRAAEKYAKVGGIAQDPTYGIPPKALARIYIEGVMAKIASDPAGAQMYSIDNMLRNLPKDPTWLMKVDLEAHNIGLSRIANNRSVKPTLFSMLRNAVVKPMAESTNPAWNAAGNFAMLLTAFHNFWGNFSVHITGLQGAHDFVTYMLDAREKSPLLLRAQAAIRGDAFNPEEREFFDMSEILESTDLADSFIKGGVTHSALFMLGMLSGGLGLGGEDDETKWRRRMSETQGVPLLLDPRDVENDFRNRMAVYLDWLPWGMDSLFKGDEVNGENRAYAQMNWMTRTFLSPIIGMERFFNSGDFSEVIFGFQDAVGNHPIMNQTLWDAALDTTALLHNSAVEAQEKGDYEKSSQLLFSAFSVMENMLLENAMVNMVYIGLDDWDRDPYKQPLRDSDGELQTDIEGNSRRNDLALQPYITEEGEIAYGYLNRDADSAQLRVLTENRLTLGLLATAGAKLMGTEDPDFLRYRMPIKTRAIEMPVPDEEEIMAFLKAASAAQMRKVNEPNVTGQELRGNVIDGIYDQARATGNFLQPDQVTNMIEGMAASLGPAAQRLKRQAMQSVTTEEAKAVIRGLWKGTLEFGTEAMSTVVIPWEMRPQLAEELTEEIIQDGIDLGLDKRAAEYRMYRLMNGTSQWQGMKDILYSQQVPGDATRIYGQLNTTVVMGPDGLPWATNFKRDSFMGAMGFAPLLGPNAAAPGTSRDARGNTVDDIYGINTGLRGLVPFDTSRNVPTDVEIGKAIEKAIKDAAAKDYTSSANKKGSSSETGSGWVDFGSGWMNWGSGWRNYGNGGGYSGGGRGYFVKMYSLPDNVAPYGNSMSFINTSNPILRRATVRRERISSERGRLNQWQ